MLTWTSCDALQPFTMRSLRLYLSMFSKRELTSALGLIFPCFVSSKRWKFFLYAWNISQYFIIFTVK